MTSYGAAAAARISEILRQRLGAGANRQHGSAILAARFAQEERKAA